MKKLDKYIQLLEDTLLTKDIDNFINLFRNYLERDKGWNAIYYKYLKELEFEIGRHGAYSDSEFIGHVQRTLTTLQMSPRKLQIAEYEENKRLELDEYYEELPIKLLHLIADAYELNMPFVVEKNTEGIIVVTLSDSNRYSSDIQISMQGTPDEYHDAMHLMDRVKLEKLEQQRKAKLLQSAKSKLTQALTPEELEVLKENGL
jgi:hypothetical protein